MNFNNYNTIGNCSPTQIINVNEPISSIDSLVIYDNCGKSYDMKSLQYSYSVDNVCWSCYMSYNEILKNTIELDSDFYIRAKLNNVVGEVRIDDENAPFSSQLSSEFQLTSCDPAQSSNTFNPYINLDSAVNLQSQLTETVSCIFGIPIYYFKLKPDMGSKDMTFKEYALMGVDQVKQIKLLIADGTMPSSKPEFADFGLDYQTDWETEISKATFATAFGNTAQPMEGDLVYIPMMKRMWMVNGAYEEKNGSLMWNATTFKVALVKYQEKGSVDLDNAEDFVNSIVKNKYDDLFGNDNRTTLDSGTAFLDTPKSAQNALYSVYESDAMRKYITCDTVSFSKDLTTYYKGTLISDSNYMFLRNDYESKIIYQNKFCGSCASISFIISPSMITSFKGTILRVGNLEVIINQNGTKSNLYTNLYNDYKIELENNSIYFVVIRWQKSMNLFDMSCYLYTYNREVPLYKLTSGHYYYDIDNPLYQISKPFSSELEVNEPLDIYVSNFYGVITNIKVFDVYNNNISELLQMYPTHQHLLLNDTARQLVGKPGVIIK